MKTEYHRISKWKRRIVEERAQARGPNKRIVWKLGGSISMIGRELKRNCGYGAWDYNRKRARRLSEKRPQDSKRLRISKKLGQGVQIV